MREYIFKRLLDNDVHELRIQMYGKEGGLKAVLSADGRSYTFTNAQGHSAKYITDPMDAFRVEYTPDDPTNDLKDADKQDAIYHALTLEVDPNQSEGGRRRRARRKTARVQKKRSKHSKHSKQSRRSKRSKRR